MLLSSKPALLAVLAFALASCTGAQISEKTYCDLQTHALAKCLLNSLGEEESPSAANALFVAGLNNLTEVTLDELADSLPPPGIYRFGLMGPHSDVFLFITDEAGLKIVEDYSVSAVTGELIRFFERSKLTENERLEYLTNLATFLQIKQLRTQGEDEGQINLN